MPDRCYSLHAVASAEAESGRPEAAARFWELAAASALLREAAGDWECRRALLFIVEGLAPHFPLRARQLAESITHPETRSLALERLVPRGR